jgi:hypothetical protein
MIHARVEEVIYGASDPKAGAVASCFQLADTSVLNHKIRVTSGILEEECGSMLKAFFAATGQTIKAKSSADSRQLVNDGADPQTVGWGFHNLNEKSSERSSAGALWVIHPIESRSTPVAAMDSAV